MNIKQITKEITPNIFLAVYRKVRHILSIVYERILLCRVRGIQKKALAKLQGKEKIRCVYFALDRAVWKYDTVFQLMQSNPRFEPVILVCPIVNDGRENMVRKMEEAYQEYKKKGYQVLKSYDEEKDTYVDVRKELNPDMIIYTNPYKGLIDDRYYITKYLDILTFYVHYGYNNTAAWDFLYKQLLTNLVWRYYVESPIHQEYVVEHSLNKGINTVVTGYPGIEDMLNPEYKIKSDPWKISDRVVKRIIWAPHHTIEAVGIIQYSNFMRYYDFMLSLAKKYSDKVQFAFKPHPLLRHKLYEKWGKEKTEAYYSAWDNLPNAFVSDGEYIDLFLTSDAMVHDSASFLIEYLYARKPVMRTMTDEAPSHFLNSFAMKCLDVYYKGYCEQDIEDFVKNIIKGDDPLKEQRDVHYLKYLLPPNGDLPSKHILNDIIDSIDNQILYRN